MKHPEQQYVIGCDIDNTLMPTAEHSVAVREAGQHALLGLCRALYEANEQSATPQLFFGSASGRTAKSQAAYAAENEVFALASRAMAFHISGVGTEIRYRADDVITLDDDWPRPVSWHVRTVRAVMDKHDELTIQEEIAQTPFKASYTVDAEAAAQSRQYVESLRSELYRINIMSSIIFSGGQYLDVLPAGITKGSALRRVSRHLATSPDPYVVGAGDSLNDCSLLEAADLAIIPSNADACLVEWAQQTLPTGQAYFAEQPFAAGIHEGLVRHGILQANTI